MLHEVTTNKSNDYLLVIQNIICPITSTWKFDKFVQENIASFWCMQYERQNMPNITRSIIVNYSSKVGLVVTPLNREHMILTNYS